MASHHKPYQGHRSYNAWNVCLYLFNDERLYRMVQSAVRSSANLDRAARRIMDALDGQKTPDGVPYTLTNVRLALQHWEG